MKTNSDLAYEETLGLAPRAADYPRNELEDARDRRSGGLAANAAYNALLRESPPDRAERYTTIVAILCGQLGNSNDSGEWGRVSRYCAEARKISTTDTNLLFFHGLALLHVSGPEAALAALESAKVDDPDVKRLVSTLRGARAQCDRQRRSFDEQPWGSLPARMTLSQKLSVTAIVAVMAIGAFVAIAKVCGLATGRLPWE